MDNYRVVFTSLADADLDDILDYIAADSPARAISFVTELRDRAVQTLSVAPMGGAKRGSVRFFPFGNYVVVYEVYQEQQGRCRAHDFARKPAMAGIDQG